MSHLFPTHLISPSYVIYSYTFTWDIVNYEEKISFRLPYSSIFSLLFRFRFITLRFPFRRRGISSAILRIYLFRWSSMKLKIRDRTKSSKEIFLSYERNKIDLDPKVVIFYWNRNWIAISWRWNFIGTSPMLPKLNFWIFVWK